MKHTIHTSTNSTATAPSTIPALAIPPNHVSAPALAPSPSRASAPASAPANVHARVPVPVPVPAPAHASVTTLAASNKYPPALVEKIK